LASWDSAADSPIVGELVCPAAVGESMAPPATVGAAVPLAEVGVSMVEAVVSGVGAAVGVVCARTVARLAINSKTSFIVD
jgi:hypothetical protein